MTAPAVVYPSPNEWPATTKSISGITNASLAVVHCVGHGFTSADVSITSVGFTQVQGMIQINGLSAVIQEIVDIDHFKVGINTTYFYPYVSGGTLTTITGEPPVETIGSQTMNTPFKNTFSTN